MSKGNTKRASLAELRRMQAEGRLHPDLAPKQGEDLGPDFWARARVVEPRPPKSVHFKVDPEVFDYFKSFGKGHLTRMQDVLKAYVEAHKGR
jgi:uncharacterized protein (DUF4415 family)